MNKLFFILVFSVLFSCSSSDSEESNQSSSCINPPEWLQGTWVKYDNNEPDVIVNKFVITSDNIIDHLYSTSTNWKVVYCNKEPYITTSEYFDNNYYSFTWSSNYAGQTTTSPGYFIKQQQSNKMMFNSYLDDEGIIFTKL